MALRAEKALFRADRMVCFGSQPKRPRTIPQEFPQARHDPDPPTQTPVSTVLIRPEYGNPCTLGSPARVAVIVSAAGGRVPRAFELLTLFMRWVPRPARFARAGTTDADRECFCLALTSQMKRNLAAPHIHPNRSGEIQGQTEHSPPTLDLVRVYVPP